MTPTETLRIKLRKLINETIPANGTEANTQFLDSEIDDLLLESVNIYGAAAAGWTIKAGLLQGKIEKYTIGQEQYTLTSIKDEYEHAITMAEQYKTVVQSSGSGTTGMMIKIKPPKVI